MTLDNRSSSTFILVNCKKKPLDPNVNQLGLVSLQVIKVVKVNRNLRTNLEKSLECFIPQYSHCCHGKRPPPSRRKQIKIKSTNLDKNVHSQKNIVSSRSPLFSASALRDILGLSEE